PNVKNAAEVRHPDALAVRREFRDERVASLAEDGLLRSGRHREIGGISQPGGINVPAAVSRHRSGEVLPRSAEQRGESRTCAQGVGPGEAKRHTGEYRRPAYARQTVDSKHILHRSKHVWHHRIFMLDLSYFRNNFDDVVRRLATRGTELNLDAFRELDRNRRAILTQSETLKARLNSESTQIGQLKREGRIRPSCRNRSGP